MASLPTRPFGTTGLDITTVGFGAWAAGGGGWSYGWGPTDDDEAVASMRRAVELGINWIDTAAVYGHGHSEELVCRLLRELPAADRPLVFTKGGFVWDPANPMGPNKSSLEPASIRRECEASLRRLGVERIDLYQFHTQDGAGVPVEDSWAEMGRLIEEGKVRFGGVSNFTVASLERCEKLHHVASLQPPLSMIRRPAAGDVIPWCHAHGTGVIVYSPMQTGILTDSFSRERIARMAEDDWRRRGDNFKEPALSRNLALRDALVPIAKRHGTSVASIAIAWTLAWPGVTAAIVGARTPAQVEGWVDAGKVKLTGGDLDEIAAAIRATGAGTGPERP